jgi:hypothetical protein
MAAGRGYLIASLVALGALCAFAEEAGKPQPANNDPCFVCHLDFKAEEMAEAHAKKGIGCVKCHGPSTAHIADESRHTAPDRVIKRGEIPGFCSACHAERKRCPFKPPSLGAAPSTKTCVSCHGKHKVQKTG